MDIELYEKIVSEIETPSKSEVFVSNWRSYMKLKHAQSCKIHFPGLSQDFPCIVFREFINLVVEQVECSRRYDRKQGASSTTAINAWTGRLHHIKESLKWCLKDEKGRCKFKCANCNNRFLFNKLECVEAELKTTKESLHATTKELDETKKVLQGTLNKLRQKEVQQCVLEKRFMEEKVGRDEEKRKFATAIAGMVQREMCDVRGELAKLTLCLKDELCEKTLAEKASSEAAKAALSASKDITLRLLMF